MRTVKYWLVAALAASLVGVSFAEDKKDAKPLAIKDVMKKFHSAPKGEDPICKKVLTGKASEAEIKDLIAGYTALTMDKPPKGEADAWKTKTTALLTAAKDVAAKKEGAIDEYKKAVNCMACHSVFRPAKPKK